GEAAPDGAAVAGAVGGALASGARSLLCPIAVGSITPNSVGTNIPFCNPPRPATVSPTFTSTKVILSPPLPFPAPDPVPGLVPDPVGGPLPAPAPPPVPAPAPIARLPPAPPISMTPAPLAMA